MARENHYTREAWLAAPEEHRDLLMHEDALVCSRCGNLTSVCSNPDVDWHPSTTTCWSSASTEWGWRKLRERYPEKAKASDGAHPLDGVRVYATQDPPEVDEFA